MAIRALARAVIRARLAPWSPALYGSGVLGESSDREAAHTNGENRAQSPARRVIWAAVGVAAIATAGLVAFDVRHPAPPLDAALVVHEALARCDTLRRVQNCGHRGAGVSRSDSPYPENTLPSFRRAEQVGATMVELDVMLSADGEVVVVHDETLERTTDGHGCVEQYPLAWLKSLDASRGTAKTQSRGRVELPTLGETMVAVDGDLNVELKVYPGLFCAPMDRDRLAHAVLGLLEEDSKSRRVVVSSFDAAVLQIVESLVPDTVTALVSEDPLALGFVAATTIDDLHVHQAAVTPSLIQAAHEAGVAVRVWTVDDPRAMIALAQAGVDGIITDYPEQLAQLTAAACAESPPLSGGD